MKIVINACYGGFGISEAAVKHMVDNGSKWIKDEISKGRDYFPDIARNDPYLVAAVEALGKEASDSLSNLIVVEIPDRIKWQIKEYDGYEHVAEVHRTWP